jgi:hypothetical protein
MTISNTERGRRTKAVQSALASVRLAGLVPSQLVICLLLEWADGIRSLDEIHTSLIAEWTAEK